MMKYFLFFLVCIIQPCVLFCQHDKQSFRINGTINADTGTIALYFFSDYTSAEKAEFITQVKNKKFSFDGYIASPEGASITFNNEYLSADFIVDKGVQSIEINTDSSRKTPLVKNATMLKEYEKYKNAFSQVQNKRTELDKEYNSIRKSSGYQLPDSLELSFTEKYNALYHEYDDTLLKYAIKYPDSYIALWRLIRLASWGYEPIFDSVYQAFSAELKDSYAGKILHNRLRKSAALNIGKRFPDIEMMSNADEHFSANIFSTSTYTLVDFWYSNCGPCLAQFEKLKEIYRSYKNKGFEIVGISVDKEEKKSDWQNTIIREKLNWQQYWDKNGKSASEFSIQAFPTNFLIDSTGKIIYKNITLVELDKLLSEN